MTGVIVLALTGVLGFGTSGTPVLTLLRNGPGPRPAAMGEAWTALADDASALHWNPAGLGQLRDYRLAAQHHEWFGSTRDELVQLAFPAGAGALALQLLYSGERDIEYWNERNEPGGTFSTWTTLAGIGYGGTIAGRWHLGLGLKGVYQSLHTSSGYGGGFDIGFLGRPLDFLSVGVAGRNFGVVRYPGAWEEMPAEVGVGVRGRWRELVGTLDGVLPLDGRLEYRAGIEYRPVRLLALRAGYRTGPADIGSLGWPGGLTAGLGLEAGGIGLDYSVAPNGPLGTIHRLGIEARIPRRGDGIVHIRTLDRPTMQPLRARVVLEGVTELAADTRRDGKLTVTGLLPGRLLIRTACPGYEPRIDTLHVLGDREQYATLALTPLEYGTVWGTLYDAATGQPIGGTIVYRGPVYGEQLVPGNTGSFALRDLPAGRYRFEAFGPESDWLPQSCSLDVVPGAITERSFRLAK
ncbi:UPF0164 family protein [candidate division WOR-3 bacterium]|nr:UPF0164 family protein [candidate division WOR-3 bacterium]